METVKLSSRGQIVIPEYLRETAHLTEGMEFSAVYVDGQIWLTPVPIVAPTTFEEAAACSKPVTTPVSK